MTKLLHTWIAAAAFLIGIWCVPAFADKIDDANTVAKLLTDGGNGSVMCRAISEDRRIMCIALIADHELEDTAKGIIDIARPLVDLSGWQLVLINQNDFVVGRNF